METITPIRQDVTTRLVDRTTSAYATGERDIMKVFPEVAREETLSATVAQSMASLTEVICLVGAGALSMDQLLSSMRSALVLASATGYAVGMEAYDDRAVEVFSFLQGGAK